MPEAAVIVANVPEAAVIAAAIDGLAAGQCAARFAREPPAIIKELFKVMNRYVRPDEDYSKSPSATPKDKRSKFLGHLSV